MSASTFLVAELRRARSAAGLSQEDLGRAINYSSSLVSAVENGHRLPTFEYLAGVDRALNTGGLLERLLVSIEQAPVWFRDWLVVERKATLIRAFQPSLVPGLLQTEDYARAILSWGALTSASEVDRRLESRMARQMILTGSEPTQLIAMLDECVLRRPVGGRAIMAAQCEHLAEQGTKRNIALHIVPLTAGGHCGLAGAFHLAKGRDFEVAHLDDTLQAETVDRPEQVDLVIRKWEAIRGEALPRAQSLEMIREVATNWRR